MVSERVQQVLLVWVVLASSFGLMYVVNGSPSNTVGSPTIEPGVNKTNGTAFITTRLGDGNVNHLGLTVERGGEEVLNESYALTPYSGVQVVGLQPDDTIRFYAVKDGTWTLAVKVPFKNLNSSWVQAVPTTDITVNETTTVS